MHEISKTESDISRAAVNESVYSPSSSISFYRQDGYENVVSENERIIELSGHAAFFGYKRDSESETSVESQKHIPSTHFSNYTSGETPPLLTSRVSNQCEM